MSRPVSGLLYGFYLLGRTSAFFNAFIESDKLGPAPGELSPPTRLKIMEWQVDLYHDSGKVFFSPAPSQKTYSIRRP